LSASVVAKAVDGSTILMVAADDAVRTQMTTLTLLTNWYIDSVVL